MPQNEIHLYGTIGMSLWDEEFFTPRDVRSMLAGRTGPLTVRLNSPGGIAADGQAIHTMLRDYPGEVHVVVDGVALSAASLIAMAGDTITMRLGSYLMIHDPALLFPSGRGTADEHRHLASALDKIGDAYAEVYAARSGKDSGEVRELMRAETYYLGAEAVEAGFATDFEDQQAAAAAAFDYRLYAHAPEILRAGSERLDEKSGQVALAAFIAGTPRNKEEASMPQPKKPAVESPAAETVEPVAVATPATPAEPAKPEPAAAAVPEPKPEAKPEAQAAQRATMTATQVSRLYQLAARSQVPATMVAEMVEAGTGFEAAIDKITSAWADQVDDLPRFGRPEPRILRDEREVQRAGMEAAITAQLGRRDPTDDRARPFMGMSLVEMAAASIGSRDSLRTVRDREQVLMAATHSTSDFPAIFENALNKELEARYREAQPTYRNIARRKTFNDFRPHPIARAGDWPEMEEIGEGGEIKYGTFGEKKESVAVKSYAVAVRVSRQMLVNDDLDAISQIIADRGRSVARFEDKVFYTLLLSGSNADGPTLNETSRQVFNTTDGTKASTAAAITVASLSIGRGQLRKRTGIDGAPLDVIASTLLVGPDKETEAQQIVAPIQAAQAGNVNPFSGTLQVVATARITGNAWYLFASPADVPCFVYGFLSGFEAPRMRMDEPFGQQGVAFSLEHDFGVGAIDFRGGFKNAGA